VEDLLAKQIAFYQSINSEWSFCSVCKFKIQIENTFLPLIHKLVVLWYGVAQNIRTVLSYIFINRTHGQKISSQPDHPDQRILWVAPDQTLS
jgi:hypothetical protein